LATYDGKDIVFSHFSKKLIKVDTKMSK